MKWTKIRPKTKFCHFFKFGSLVFLEITKVDSLEHCLSTSRFNTHEKKKKKGGPKLGLKLSFSHFLKVASLVFLDIAQGCSLGQCVTSSRAETSEKYVGGRNDLFYSDVVERPLKLF